MTFPREKVIKSNGKFGTVSLRNIPIFRTGKGVVARHLTKSEQTFGKSCPDTFLQNPEHAIGRRQV